MTNELSPAELTQLLESLESRLAYQEHWLDTLDQAVAQQERRLEKLEQLSTLMRDRLREQYQALQADNSQGDSRPEDDVPPHY
ncbi:MULTISPECIES: SlyX family protein [Halomonadaceae]|uniref:SlyX n=2 Tax=Halomonadaceae TaxID=28256 RepID=A0AAP9ZMM7_9GAMM|nr:MULTISPECIES: SlyX family protein [Halomonas]MBR9925076.1 SlyX family protein [Gammaproteobacteria bacterium]AZM94617.1 SlyX family protein [Halomonas venusta]MDW0359406.1 SlyX family protein [Halomonas venusta]MDX1356457.1 SlyX family protein [Halomonas venusta]MDX1713334.1 SlyX family protein [Halomonas venusta]